MKLIDRITNKLWRTFPIPKALVKIGSSKFGIPRILPNHFYKASYQTEDWLSELLKKIHVRQPLHCVIDVGVNIGQTLLKLKSINPAMKYIGFEPNPHCCSISLEIVSNNNLGNVCIIPSGLSDRCQILKLELNHDDSVDSSATLIEGFRSSEGKSFQHVSVVVLDEIWQSLSIEKLDLIKIDIEGAELEAMKGMRGVIDQHKPIIIIEVLPSYELSNTFRIKRQSDLAQIISDLGYSIYQIKKDNDSNVHLVKIPDFPVHKNVKESDYILLPKHINGSEFA